MTIQFDLEIHDSMLMAIQLSRHGARTGKGHDPFNVFYEEDEITNTGRRQHYIMGQQMRERYINQTKLLSPYYNASEIKIKTTNDNETIESAISQVLGLYPAQYSKYSLLEEYQTSYALPQFNISNDVLTSTQNENLNKALPFNIYPFKIHATNTPYDYFLQGKTCEFVRNEIDSIKSSPDLYSYLDQKYGDTIYRLAEAIYRDPSIFKAQDAVKYIDSLYAKYIDQQKITPGMTQQMVHDMMVLYYDYLNQTIIRNPTVLKALLTSSFTKILYKFNKQIEWDKGRHIPKNDQHKMLIYIDHDDIILYYSNLLNHLLFHPMQVEYVPFASVIMFELHKFQDGKYYVNASINGEAVSLPGTCKDQYYCEFTDFEELARKNSYYEDQSAYERLCGISLENKYAMKMSSWNESFKYATGILRKKVNPYLRVLELYFVLMLLITLSWIIYQNLKGRDQQQAQRNPYQPVERNNDVEMT